MIVTTQTYNNSDAREKEVKRWKTESNGTLRRQVTQQTSKTSKTKMLNWTHLIYNDI